VSRRTGSAERLALKAVVPQPAWCTVLGRPGAGYVSGVKPTRADDRVSVFRQSGLRAWHARKGHTIIEAPVPTSTCRERKATGQPLTVTNPRHATCCAPRVPARESSCAIGAPELAPNRVRSR